MAIRPNGQRSSSVTLFLLLILSCLDGHLTRADHHPFCQSNCARVKLRSIRIDCLLSCDQELAGVFYRAGRRDLSPSYLGLGGGDEERDDREPIDVPFDDVILREPRDRSAFVRIGKRDVSSLAKRRDEFVRIGKDEPRHISRAFLLSRSYRGLSDIDGTEKQLLDQPAEIGKRKTVLIPVSGSIKRPSAFVRIGKSEKPEEETGAASEEEEEAGSLLVPQPHQSDGNSDYGGINRPAADDLYPRPDDPPGEQVDKKASAFVRIGRGRGAAFVRIGKSDPGVKKWEEQDPGEAKQL